MIASTCAIETPPSAARRRYLANLAALYRVEPRLAARIDALPFATMPKPLPAREGGFTACVTADDGREVHAHSRYNPVDEARRFIQARPDVDNPTFVLAGLGLGYHLPELVSRFGKPLILVIEADLALLKAALCVQELEAELLAGRLLFIWEDDKGAVDEKLKRVNADIMLGVQFITTPLGQRRGITFQTRVQAYFADAVAALRMQMLTLLQTARVTYENVIRNLPAYLRRPGVETLRGRAKGFPAIVVAAGPSLARDLPLIREAQSRAVVITVQTVFKLLRAYGIQPHFVTSLDFHEVSAEFFREAGDVGDCALVCEPKAAWRVLDAYPGRIHVLRSRVHDLLLREANPERGRLPAGSTVAHLSFYLAQHLGCDPIVFAGQDLAFTDGLFYLPGSPIEDTWAPELGRFQTVESKQWERIVRNRPILRSFEAADGRRCFTDDLLFTYAEQFRSDFTSAPQEVLVGSPSGAALTGATCMPLARAIERYCVRSLPRALLQPVEGAGAADEGRARAALDERVREIERMREIAVEMRGLLERLSELVERPAEFNRLVARVDDLRSAITQYDEVYGLASEVSATAELRRHGADRRIGAPEAETPEIARRRLKRDSEFVAAFIESCDFLLRVTPLAFAKEPAPCA